MNRILYGIMAPCILIALVACNPAQNQLPAAIQEPVTSGVVAEGHILPKENIHLSFQAPGRINSIEVNEGASITLGQKLASLGDRAEAEHAAASAQMELEAAQQEYDQVVRTAGLVNAQAWTAFLDAQIVRAEAEEDWEKLDLDQIKDDIEDAESDVKDFQADLKEAEDDLEKYKDLDEDSSKRKEAEDDLEIAQEDYNESVRKLEEIIQKRDLKRAALDEAIQSQAEAKRAYENSLGQPDKDAFAMADRRLEQAKAQMALAEQQLSYFDIISPFDGIVTDVNASLGEWVSPTDWVIGVADTSEWYVETTDLSELDVVGIQVGQPVEITADAIPGQTYSGTVEEIGIEPVDQGGDIYYTIRIKISNPDEVIRWGMTVEVKFPSNNSTE